MLARAPHHPPSIATAHTGSVYKPFRDSFRTVVCMVRKPTASTLQTPRLRRVCVCGAAVGSSIPTPLKAAFWVINARGCGSDRGARCGASCKGETGVQGVRAECPQSPLLERSRRMPAITACQAIGGTTLRVPTPPTAPQPTRCLSSGGTNAGHMPKGASINDTFPEVRKSSRPCAPLPTPVPPHSHPLSRGQCMGYRGGGGDSLGFRFG
jgi:hypothetical protein